jgi:hypothetical protein
MTRIKRVKDDVETKGKWVKGLPLQNKFDEKLY